MSIIIWTRYKNHNNSKLRTKKLLLAKTQALFTYGNSTNAFASGMRTKSKELGG